MYPYSSSMAQGALRAQGALTLTPALTPTLTPTLPLPLPPNPNQALTWKSGPRAATSRSACSRRRSHASSHHVTLTLTLTLTLNLTLTLTLTLNPKP